MKEKHKNENKKKREKLLHATKRNGKFHFPIFFYFRNYIKFSFFPLFILMKNWIEISNLLIA
jgi:hypothetical protein